MSRVAVISAKARRPNAARLFLDYLLSRRGQTVIGSRADLYALRDDVVGPTTAEKIKGHFALESVGEREFKNVSAPIRVYRVIPPGVYEKIA